MTDDDTLVEILTRSADRVMQGLVKRHPWDVIIASPYITDPVIDRVTSWASLRSTVIMTTFDPETFLAGGSSIDALGRLVAEGFEVRALDNLHAKIVLAGDAATVGSQNVTHGGTRNREATVLVRGREAVDDLRAALEAWLAESERISPEMVEHMREEVERLRKYAWALKRIRKGAKDARDRIRKAEEERKRKRKEEEDRKRREREGKGKPKPPAAPRQPGDGTHIDWVPGGNLRDAVLDAQPVREAIAVRVDRSQGKAALVRRGNRTLTKWAVGEGAEGFTVEQFDRGVRFLAIAPETGRLAWPTLFKSRLSNFSFNSPPPSGIFIKPGFFRVMCEANPDCRPGSLWNVRFLLGRILITGHKPVNPIRIEAFFALDRLVIRSVTGPEAYARFFDRLHREAETLDSPTHKALMAAIFSRFRHEHNKEGDGADVFCQGLPQDMRLRLRRSGSFHFFTVESPDFQAKRAGEARTDEARAPRAAAMA